MKKFLMLILFIVLFASFVFAINLTNPIFAEIKALALVAPINKNGAYFLSREIQDETCKIIYVIGYTPEEKLIGVIIIQGYRRTVVTYDEKNGEYVIGVFNGNRIIFTQKISEVDAVKIATSILELFK